MSLLFFLSPAAARKNKEAEAIATRNYDLAFIYAGEAVGLVSKQQPATEIIRQLGEGAEELLQSRFSSLLGQS